MASTSQPPRQLFSLEIWAIFPSMPTARIQTRSLKAFLSLSICTCLLSGCSTFNREWKSAGAFPPGTNDLQGRWEGIWISDVNHHTDSLRCVIAKKDTNSFRARFHAKYHKVFTFGYTVTLNATEDRGVWNFNGEANLGWYAGGLYRYLGHADATNFFSTYSCKYDHGTFQMSRPQMNQPH